MSRCCADLLANYTSSLLGQEGSLVPGASSFGPEVDYRLTSIPSRMTIPFARLYDHLQWADHKVLESLRSAQNPPAKALEIFAHVLGAEHVWLSRIEGRPAIMAVWPSLTLDQCDTIASQNAESFKKLVKSPTHSSLARKIDYRNSAGESFTSTLEDILTHVALHGSYHRGQVAASLRAAGETPSATDYIAFTRGSPAATRTNS